MDCSSRSTSSHDIRQHVKAYYGRLFGGDSAPAQRLPIHQGKDLAAVLHYPLNVLEDLPDRIWDDFLPCGNPLQLTRPRSGDQILNLGSGAGIDSIALARACDHPIHIVNVDVVFEVLAKSKAVTLDLGFTESNPAKSTIRWVRAEGEHLPFRPGSFDWIVMNGVFNLFPNKEHLLGELGQALKMNAHLVVTDLCAAAELPEYFEGQLDGWAWCMSGAKTPAQLEAMLEAVGLKLVMFSESEEPDMFFRMGLIAQKV